MLEMIVTGLITGAMGYIFPQPKWAGMLQAVLWDWLQRKFKAMLARK